MVIELELFGIPTRIQPWFFLTAFFLGRGREPLHLVIWMVVVLVGVLLHELGHAFAGRRFGFEPQIELHAFGGVTSWRVSRSITPLRELLISAAGPAVGLVVGSAALAAAMVTRPAPHTPAAFLGADLVWVNLGWAIINLLPILPLDGGNIATSLAEMVWPDRGRRVARVLSLTVTCGLVALALLVGELWMAIISAVLAFSNWQALRHERGFPTRPRKRPPQADLQPELGALAEAFNRRQWSDVVASAESLLAGADSDDLRTHARYYLAWGRLSLGDFEAAREAVDALPQGAVDSALEGRLLLAEGRAAGAADALQHALSTGGDRDLEQAWAQAVAGSRGWTRAITFVQRTSSRVVSDDTLSVLEQGAYDAGDFSAAAELGMVRFARRPAPRTAFNIACSLARAGHDDDALAWLDRAVAKGLDDPSLLEDDPDLEPLRSLPAFQAIRRRMER